MTNETLSILQKREEIERGLTGYLNHRHIEQALQHWESKYGNLPSHVFAFALPEFTGSFPHG